MVSTYQSQPLLLHNCSYPLKEKYIYIYIYFKGLLILSPMAFLGEGEQNGQQRTLTSKQDCVRVSSY